MKDSGILQVSKWSQYTEGWDIASWGGEVMMRSCVRKLDRTWRPTGRPGTEILGYDFTMGMWRFSTVDFVMDWGERQTTRIPCSERGYWTRCDGISRPQNGVSPMILPCHKLYARLRSHASYIFRAVSASPTGLWRRLTELGLLINIISETHLTDILGVTLDTIMSSCTSWTKLLEKTFSIHTRFCLRKFIIHKLILSFGFTWW